jgi:predicted ATPase with chaperone activity
VKDRDAAAREQEPDFGEVKGQQHLKRAVEVAAAGSHNILRLWPPGVVTAPILNLFLKNVLTQLLAQSNCDASHGI